MHAVCCCVLLDVQVEELARTEAAEQAAGLALESIHDAQLQHEGVVARLRSEHEVAVGSHVSRYDELSSQQQEGVDR
jgi:hypothetical protein